VVGYQAHRLTPQDQPAMSGLGDDGLEPVIRDDVPGGVERAP
jgi:hypothetical protein